MILLTGATGLLGAHIAFELVQSGNKIRAIRRSNSQTSVLEQIFHLYSKNANELLRQIEWCEAELLDADAIEHALKGVNQVYHAAALVSYHPADRQQLLDTNIEGTALLVNLCLELGIKRFCHISSVAALGRTSDGSVIDENVWWKTSPDNSWYAISKYGAEREVWRAAEEGLDVVILNPSFILGPGDPKRSSSELFGVLQKGTSWYTSGITGYVDVRDVALAARLLMNSEISNERFILNAKNSSFKEIFDQVLSEFKNPPTKYKAGPFLIGLGWRLEKIRSVFTGTSPRITKETAAASQLINHFGGEKITKRIDFKYRDLQKSIQEIATFYRST
jgi:dihydroflavonol-4-reductase